MNFRAHCRVSISVALALAATLALGANPTGTTCATDQRLSGPCFKVRGRLSLWNGAPSVRIWVVGTKRILGVSEGRFTPDHYALLPAPLPQTLDWETDYFGSYAVCPFEPDTRGTMRLVCVAGVEGLSIRRRDADASNFRSERP